MSDKIDRIPVAPLALLPLKSIEPLTAEVDHYVADWRKNRRNNFMDSPVFSGYVKDSYMIPAETPRFGSGEAKGHLLQSVRGDDLYILVDVLNYSITYKMFGEPNRMSPDDHYQDLKRVIAATTGKAKRINVIMPFMYESRQHKRSSRESLDCAMMLQELHAMGVENFITFDAHDPRVMNAIPEDSFDNVPCAYQFIKALLCTYSDLQVDNKHMMIISPDEGGMGRAIYYANVLGLDMGMFYKRRDYSKVVNGRNPIVAHEFLGSNVEGMDVVIIDDMISSGDSMVDTASELKAMKARRVIACTTFGLFTNGFEKFDKAYKDGIIDAIFTTNLIYQKPELLTKPWYHSVDMAKQIALLIDRLNHDESISDLLDNTLKIQTVLNDYRTGNIDCHRKH